MRVLITGGAGFLGSHLADAFLKRGDEVFALDIASDEKIRHNLGKRRFHFIQDSFMDTEALSTWIARCDLVYHLGAVVGVEHYVTDPYKVLNINVNGTQNVLRLAHRYGKKVVFSSTSEVYGRNPAVPFREDDDRVLGSTRVDRWCYSTSKAVGEHFCFAYAKMGLPVVVLRYFNVYGPRLDRLDLGRVLTIFMGRLQQGKRLRVIGDGSQTRCFTYVTDAIRATVAAGLHPKAPGGIFNIGTEEETSILELARHLLRIYGARADRIEFVPQQEVYGSSYEDVPRRVPDITRMRKILRVSPSVSLDKGLRDTVAWFRRSLQAAANAG